MKLLPIVLSVKRKAFRADSPNPSGMDRAYVDARKKALERDKHTCRFCSYRSSKNEVHHLNDDHDDQSLSNLMTACVLCHMCFHIAYAGTQGRGKLIYLPDVSITQADFNQMVRQLWVAETIGSGDAKGTATQLLARLDKAELHAASVLGTASPAMLGDHLSCLPDAEYAKRGDALNGVFLLPIKQAYSPFIKLWCEEARHFQPQSWIDTAKTKFSEWGGIV